MKAVVGELKQNIRRRVARMFNGTAQDRIASFKAKAAEEKRARLPVAQEPAIPFTSAAPLRGLASIRIKRTAGNPAARFVGSLKSAPSGSGPRRTRLPSGGGSSRATDSNYASADEFSGTALASAGPTPSKRRLSRGAEENELPSDEEERDEVAEQQQGRQQTNDQDAGDSSPDFRSHRTNRKRRKDGSLSNSGHSPTNVPVESTAEEKEDEEEQEGGESGSGSESSASIDGEMYGGSSEELDSGDAMVLATAGSRGEEDGEDGTDMADTKLESESEAESESGEWQVRPKRAQPKQTVTPASSRLRVPKRSRDETEEEEEEEEKAEAEAEAEAEEEEGTKVEVRIVKDSKVSPSKRHRLADPYAADASKGLVFAGDTVPAILTKARALPLPSTTPGPFDDAALASAADLLRMMDSEDVEYVIRAFKEHPQADTRLMRWFPALLRACSITMPPADDAAPIDDRPTHGATATTLALTGPVDGAKHMGGSARSQGYYFVKASEKKKKVASGRQQVSGRLSCRLYFVPLKQHLVGPMRQKYCVFRPDVPLTSDC